MSISIVQSKTAGAGSTGSCGVTFTSPPTTGNLIVVLIGFDQTTSISVTGINDPAGNTYIQATGAQAGPTLMYQSYSDIWYCPNAITPGGLIDVTFSQGFDHAVVTAVEISGAKTSSVVDTTNAIIASASPTVGPAITPSVAGELLLCVAYTQSVLLTGASGAWAPGNPDSSETGYCWADYIGAPLSSQACNFTPTTNADYASSVASFLPATGASGVQKASTFLVF